MWGSPSIVAGRGSPPVDSSTRRRLPSRAAAPSIPVAGPGLGHGHFTSLMIHLYIFSPEQTGAVLCPLFSPCREPPHFDTGTRSRPSSSGGEIRLEGDTHADASWSVDSFDQPAPAQPGRGRAGRHGLVGREFGSLATYWGEGAALYAHMARLFLAALPLWVTTPHHTTFSLPPPPPPPSPGVRRGAAAGVDAPRT